MSRDLRGYGGKWPEVRWPGGARVAVSIVVNFEEGGELTVSGGDARNEAVYEVVDEKRGPDLAIESHFDYGTRAGYWRIVEVLERFGAKATFSACGRAVEAAPWLARDAVERGHEVAAHGYRWVSHAGMSEAEERESIVGSIRAIEAATGRRPVGGIRGRRRRRGRGSYWSSTGFYMTATRTTTTCPTSWRSAGGGI